MKRILYFAVALAASFAVTCGNAKNAVYETVTAEETALLDSLWNRKFKDAKSIIALHDSIKQATAEEKKGMHTLNQCHYVWHSGEYMFSCRGNNEDIYELPVQSTELSFDNTVVAQFASTKKIGRFADHYFTLQAMKSGDSFNDSRDGVTATVFYPIRALNENDYYKLRAIFSSNNEALHNEYLKRLKFPLNNSGCTDGLKSIEPLIEKNVAESNLKREILEFYSIFSRMMPGEPAPLSTLKDTEGNEHTFAEFKGKVIVIDVWATWCSSCIANMPKFIALSNEYKGRNDISFITISIDRSEDKETWLENIERNSMQPLLNLFPDCEMQSQFESDFQISGVPRYIIIGKKGKIVSAHAPSPGPEMVKLIESALSAE